MHFHAIPKHLPGLSDAFQFSGHGPAGIGSLVGVKRHRIESAEAEPGDGSGSGVLFGVTVENAAHIGGK